MSILIIADGYVSDGDGNIVGGPDEYADEIAASAAAEDVTE